MRNTAFSVLLASLLLLQLAGSSCKKDDKPTKAPAPAETATPTEEAESAPADKDASKLLKKPFFYQVEGPNGANGHLLGTMHMGVDAKEELPASVWKAVDDCTVLVVEADVTDPNLAADLMRKDGTTLRQEIGEEAWKLLEEALGKPVANAMNQFKPAAAASTLAMKGIPMTVPMDMLLVTTAQAAKKDVEYLETGAFQIALLDAIMTGEFLVEMLKNPDQADASKLLATYRSGDEAEIVKSTMDPANWGTKPEENMNAMLFQRNENWIPLFEKLFARKNAFIGVGAAHLFGERGVLKMLEAKGYTVTRLP